MFEIIRKLLAGLLSRGDTTVSVAPPAPSGKIALVVGHNAYAQGAVRALDGVSEFVWNGKLAQMIAALSPANYVVVHRTAGAGEIARAYREVTASGALASVEIHFNASEAASATGTETLTSGSAKSVRLAGAINDAMVAVLGLKNRGVKTVPKGGRGYVSLNAADAPAVLIESYFGSNANDCAVADAKISALAAAINEACLAYLAES